MIPGRTPLRDLLPDPNHPRLADIQIRHFFERSFITLTHPDPVSGDSISRTATEPQRIRSARMSADPTGDTVEVAILVDGRSVIDSVLSGGVTYFPTRDSPVFPAGTLITSDFLGVTGTPTGPVSVIIELDSFIVTPRTEAEPRGRDRLFPSRRDEADRINRTIAELRPDASLARSEGLVGYLGRSRERDIRNPDPIRRIDHRFRPRRPR